MITREQFLKNTNEEELFAVFESVKQRIINLRNKEKEVLISCLNNSVLRQNDFSDLVYSFATVSTDKETGKAIKQTLKEWKP